MKQAILLAGFAGLLSFIPPAFCQKPVHGLYKLRGLYIDQINKPAKRINNGVQYWLELKRNGLRTKVTNRTQFFDDDRIRIHVKPNFNGYAYVLMLQGSNGDRSVLFPGPELGTNKMTAGQELVLPVAGAGKEAWIKFDENPGTEVVRVLLSRGKINAEEELNKASVVIAGADGNGDDVPDDTSVCVVASRDSKLRHSTSRNVVVETAANPAEQGHTYVVSTPRKMLSVDIALDHKSKS